MSGRLSTYTPPPTATTTDDRTVVPPPAARLVQVELDSTSRPLGVFSTMQGDRRPFALVGAWAGGGAVLGSEPLAVAEGPVRALAALDELPVVDRDGATAAVGGGWVGYLGYGVGSTIERLPLSPHHPVPPTRAVMAYYDHVVRFEAASRRWLFEALWTPERADALRERLALWRERVCRAGAPGTRSPSFGSIRRLVAVPGAGRHVEAVSRALEHIYAGDLFQVNVCMRLEALFEGDPAALFARGAEVLAPPYGAFVSGPEMSVASFSPELFLRRVGDVVTTSPIKGTMRRDGTTTAVGALRRSEKDRAENLMIVDLMRNDLGRVAAFGTVSVPHLFRVEEHPGVCHLVSDVTARVHSSVRTSDLLRATFPPGSVTGAPKVRAMQLISVLEVAGREVYTGAIGLASPLSGLELNVAIRTVEMADERLWLGVGGGIVADSIPAAELEECHLKAEPILRAIMPASRREHTSADLAPRETAYQEAGN